MEIYREDSHSTGNVLESTTEMPEKFNTLSNQELIVLKAIINRGRITTKEVEQILEIKEKKAREILKKMTDEGLMVRKSKGKNTYYEIPYIK
ncbi:helix-turn-helix domain-containing protein [Caldicellulosiruptoraceae bacterium PP1]